MKNRTRFTILVGVSLVASFFFSCASQPKHYLYQTKREEVSLRPLPAGYHHLTLYHHPYGITEVALFERLSSIYFRENLVVSLAWGRPRPLFTSRQQGLLARLLSQALATVSSDQAVYFAAVDAEGSHRQTKGYCFVIGDDLHLVIEAVREPDYLGEEKAYQPRRRQWRLDPQEGQQLFAARLGEKDAQENWLVVHLKGGADAQPNP